MYRNFNEYLESKFGQNEADFLVDGIIETVLPMGGDEENCISVFYPGDMISLSAYYGKFEDKYGRAICAYLDNYNEREDSEYELRYFDGRIWAEVDDFGLNDQQAIQLIEDVMKFFSDDNEVLKGLRALTADAETRQQLIEDRVLTLKARACKCEQQGDHFMAMELLKEVCELYYGYDYMEIIAIHYLHGLDKPHLNLHFPKNKEYALECMLLGIEKAEHNSILPILAYSLAKDLGREDVCARIEGIGQKRGSWERMALRMEGDSTEILTRIAKCYREGIGCRKSNRRAVYYDRLAAGERQKVFRDMLVNRVDRVFYLMTDTEYYHIQSLADLEGISDDFKAKFLYGDMQGKCDLPAWFVPVVNGLNEVDRDIVLAEAMQRMEQDINALEEEIQSGEADILTADHEYSGVLLEGTNGLQYIYVPDISSLVECEAKVALQRTFDRLNNLRVGK